jgi:effector-binding domain-containing protein
MATTIVKQNDKLTGGFNNVFDYISGNNSQKEKISMTTPVVTTIHDSLQTTQFLVPSKYGSEPPTPSSDNVTITTIESGLYLAVRFRGSWSKDLFNKKQKELKSFANANKYQLVSTSFILRYNPPITPGFLRKNEIMFKVVKDEKTT